MLTSRLCLVQGHVKLPLGVSRLGPQTENGEKQPWCNCWPWWTDGSELIAAPETGDVAVLDPDSMLRLNFR